MYDIKAYDTLEIGDKEAIIYSWEDKWMEWNKAYEKELSTLAEQSWRETPAGKREMNVELNLDATYYGIILNNTQEIIRIHHQIGRQLLSKPLDIHGFESQWRSKSLQLRFTSVLEGLRYAEQVVLGRSTPDLTVESMVRNENGFILLLRHFLQSFVSHPNRDGYDEWADSTGAFNQFYENVRNDNLSEDASDRLRLCQAVDNSDRQIFVARFVFGVLLNLGFVESEFFRTPTIDLPRLPIDRRGRQIGTHGGRRTYASRATKEEEPAKSPAEELQQTLNEPCESCYRIRDEIKELVESDSYLQHCSRCLRVNRHIAYCSTSCQTLDWPRHKKQFYCGKVLSSVFPLPDFAPPSLTPSPTVAYQCQFNSLVPRSPEAVYTIRRQVEFRKKRNGSFTAEKYEVKFDHPTQDHTWTEDFEMLRKILAEKLDMKVLKELCEMILQTVEWDDEIKNYKQLNRAVVRQVMAEFDVREPIKMLCGVPMYKKDRRGKERLIDSEVDEDSEYSNGDSDSFDSKSPPATNGKKKKKNKKKKKKTANPDSTSPPSSSTSTLPSSSSAQPSARQVPPPPRPSASGHQTNLDEIDGNPHEPECSCGRAHETQRGGRDEWMSWYREGRDATLAGMMRSLGNYQADISRQMRSMNL